MIDKQGRPARLARPGGGAAAPPTDPDGIADDDDKLPPTCEPNSETSTCRTFSVWVSIAALGATTVVARSARWRPSSLNFMGLTGMPFFGAPW